MVVPRRPRLMRPISRCFAGSAANGPWSLYVADTQALDYGAISNGWSLNLSIGNPVPSYTDLELTVVPRPPAATVSNNLVYTVGLTNYGPAPATGVVITDVLPSGRGFYVSNNFPGDRQQQRGFDLCRQHPGVRRRHFFQRRRHAGGRHDGDQCVPGCLTTNLKAAPTTRPTWSPRLASRAPIWE